MNDDIGKHQLPNSRSQNYVYDVFISYSRSDKVWVWNWLVPQLKQQGLVVCTDRETFKPGVPALLNIENAVDSSRHTIIILSPAYMNNEWSVYETLLAQHEDPIGLRQRMLPVMRERCLLPRRISMLTYVDLTEGANDELEFRKLLNVLHGEGHFAKSNSNPANSIQTSIASEETTILNLSKTAVVRELLSASFSDEELTAFCFDHFRPVYENFAVGMSKGYKIQQLLEYCDRHQHTNALLDLVQQFNPLQYSRFVGQLR